MPENILEVKNLSVSFNDEKVIENLNFNLKDRENLVIIGPNGAGKSVLLRALIGAIPFAGEVKWAKNIKVGYVPQKFLPEKNIPLNVEEFFGFKTRLPAGKMLGRERIKNALKRVGINDLSIMAKRIGVISFGQLQRILIAWALIDKPEVLLFDEPFSGIDLEGGETIYNLLAQIEKELNLTIILITHDLNVVYRLADTVLCLNKKMICYGPAPETLTTESLERLYKGGIKFHEHGHEFI